MENSNDRSSYRLQAATGFIVAAIVPTFTVRQRIDADFWLLRSLDGEQRWLGAGCIVADRRCIHDAVAHSFDASGGHLVIGAERKAAGKHLRCVVKGQSPSDVPRIECECRTRLHQA
ncbi:hypothetical protein GCM10007908_25730 [Rhizobium albus]|nr:hypothetical protein GCM10007908_25730 [Rhizobium albus]